MIVQLNDKYSTVVNTDNIKRVSYGGDYPFLYCFDLKIDDITISYSSSEHRNEDYDKLVKAMKYESND